MVWKHVNFAARGDPDLAVRRSVRPQVTLEEGRQTLPGVRGDWQCGARLFNSLPQARTVLSGTEPLSSPYGVQRIVLACMVSRYSLTPAIFPSRIVKRK
jgi:hypothetical protein